MFAAAVLLTAAVCVRPAFGQRPAVSPAQLLDVPYLPQSESLCGGAAAAMVMRYWGEQNVYAETFAELVDRSAGGIHADDLLRSLRTRGWAADSFSGDAGLVQAALRARHPPIVLIEDRPGRFHYVVIVGWTSGRVIAHDPARAPFRVIDERAFTEAWKKSGFWTLVALPGSPVPPARSPDTPLSTGAVAKVPSVRTPCDAMVDEGVRLANAGEAVRARQTLEGAAESCPESAAPWRELAGLHALAGEWAAAASGARHALARDAADAHATRILATALYLLNDPEGALDAWNRVGEPVIDLVNILGLERTRYAVASHAMGLVPQQVLTRASLAAARRRLAELPSAQTARIAFRPAENGRAQVDAVVLERPLAPTTPVALAATGLRALTDREVAATVSAPTGGGETWTAAWRWWEHRPRATFRFDAPSPVGGYWGVELFDERQTYSIGPAIEESRRRAEFHISDWTRRGLRWETAIAIDRWKGIATHAVSARVDLRHRFDGDRGSIGVAAASWFGELTTRTMSVRTEWRSRVRNEGTVWSLRAGEDRVAGTAPLALWPGAGTGQGRDVLLRAHPLLRDGVIRDGVFGRSLMHAGAEWRRWVQLPGKPIRMGPAVFVDGARSTHGLFGMDDRHEADLGAGLRIAVPGSGVLRIDVARGLRDGRSAVSVGWVR